MDFDLNFSEDALAIEQPDGFLLVWNNFERDNWGFYVHDPQGRVVFFNGAERNSPDVIETEWFYRDDEQEEKKMVVTRFWSNGRKRSVHTFFKKEGGDILEEWDEEGLPSKLTRKLPDGETISTEYKYEIYDDFHVVASRKVGTEGWTRVHKDGPPSEYGSSLSRTRHVRRSDGSTPWGSFNPLVSGFVSEE